MKALLILGLLLGLPRVAGAEPSVVYLATGSLEREVVLVEGFDGKKRRTLLSGLGVNTRLVTHPSSSRYAIRLEHADRVGRVRFDRPDAYWVFGKTDGDVTAWVAADRDSVHLGAGEYHAVFSTAGDRLLVQGEYYGGEADMGERLVAYAVERAEQRRVFERRRDKKLGNVTGLSYTPAGDRFAFVGTSGTTTRLYQEAAGAKAPALLLETTEGAPGGALSPPTLLAGDQVLFGLGGKLAAIHVATKAQRTFEAGVPRRWIPGRNLVVTIGKYQSVEPTPAQLVDLASGKVTSLGAQVLDLFDVSVDGRWLLYARRAPKDEVQLVLRDLDSGRERTLDGGPTRARIEQAGFVTLGR